MENIVELRHFDIHREIRTICDANHDGLGAVIEQYCASGWHPFSFASRYLNVAEKKYSTNELELLAVVWATERFRNYTWPVFHGYIGSQGTTYILKFFTEGK